MSNVGYTEFDLSAPLPIGNGQTLDNLVVRDIYISINFFNNYFVIDLSKNVLTYCWFGRRLYFDFKKLILAEGFAVII